MGELITNALQAFQPLAGRPSHLLPPIPLALDVESMVDVVVNGAAPPVPARVLNAGLSDLRSTTEAHVGTRDYAVGVGLILTALARRGIINVVV